MTATVLDRFSVVAEAAGRIRVQGSWLVSLLFAQAHLCNRIAEGVELEGFEESAKRLRAHAFAYAAVAAVIPFAPGVVPVRLLASYAEVTACARTPETPLHGYLATAVAAYRMDKVIVELIRAQARRAPSLNRAADEGAALLASSRRTAEEVRELTENVSCGTQ